MSGSSSSGRKAVTMVDSHAHMDLNHYAKDRDTAIKRAEEAGVRLIVNIGIDLASSLRSIELAEKYPFIYASVGIHPHDAARAPKGYINKLEEMAKHPKVVAVGEMGLDFYRDRSPRPVQREVFKEQLRLARKINLPVIIHDRDAHEEVARILEEEGLPETGGVMHCFSGDTVLAKKMLALGLYISIAGPVTYTKNTTLGGVAAMVPPGKLLVETDAPFLTPHPLRGQRNEPGFIRHTTEKVAALRGKTAEHIGRLCLENTQNLFRIQPI